MSCKNNNRFNIFFNVHFVPTPECPQEMLTSQREIVVSTVLEFSTISERASKKVWCFMWALFLHIEPYSLFSSRGLYSKRTNLSRRNDDIHFKTLNKPINHGAVGKVKLHCFELAMPLIFRFTSKYHSNIPPPFSQFYKILDSISYCELDVEL